MQDTILRCLIVLDFAYFLALCEGFEHGIIELHIYTGKEFGTATTILMNL